METLNTIFAIPECSFWTFTFFLFRIINLSFFTFCTLFSFIIEIFCFITSYTFILLQNWCFRRTLNAFLFVFIIIRIFFTLKTSLRCLIKVFRRRACDATILYFIWVIRWTLTNHLLCIFYFTILTGFTNLLFLIINLFFFTLTNLLFFIIGLGIRALNTWPIHFKWSLFRAKTFFVCKIKSLSLWTVCW